MEEKFEVKSVKFNFLMNVILKMSGVIFPLITFPYVSRVLFSEANGKIAFATSVIGYFSLVASMGIPSYGIRKCAEVRDDRERLSKVVKELLILNSIFTFLSYVVFAILLIIVPKFASETPLFLITSITIIFNMLGVEWFYQAIEQYQYITIRNITFKIVSILLMFILVHEPADYVLYAGINVLASVGSNILNVMRLSRYVELRGVKVQKYDLYIHLMPIITLFLYNATTVIFTSLDQVMLGFLTEDASVGFYSAAIKIKNILVSLITALGAVMLPKISYALKNESQTDFNRMITKSFNFIFISAVPVAMFFALMAKEIILVLAGETYVDAISILQFLMPSIIFIGLSSVTAWQLLIPLGKEKYTVIGAVIGAGVNILVNILAIPRLDAVGAALASSLAELAVLLVHAKALKDVLRKNFEGRELILSLVGTGISALATWGGKLLIVSNSNFFICLLCGFLFFGSYGLLLLIFKEKLITEAVHQIKGKLRQRGV
ncbi:flippase [Streptococcus ruminantium]|uniref:Flippase n=1 Tax=Streptococcus ruminantium TaxID=1917441 RepID=A0A2Z5TRL4_9STRE|nr:flippase [Streptococcus ruminantium]BBA92995.1 flippase [Streptococcus ruminantium]